MFMALQDFLERIGTEMLPLEEWLASRTHLAGCFDGSSQCWQTRPRAVRLLFHPSCPRVTRAGHLAYGSCRAPGAHDHLRPESVSSFASV